MHQTLYIWRTHVKQLDSAVHLLPQARPVEIEERVIARHFANHIVRNARPPAQPREMELSYLALSPHVMHQEVAFSFAPYESHNSSFSTGASGVVYDPSTTRSMVRCLLSWRVASNRLLVGTNDRADHQKLRSRGHTTGLSTPN